MICWILDNGSVLAWGYNQDGELGDGTNITRGYPAPIPGLNNVVGMDAGWYHSVAVLGSVFWNEKFESDLI